MYEDHGIRKLISACVESTPLQDACESRVRLLTGFDEAEPIVLRKGADMVALPDQFLWVAKLQNAC